MVEIREARSGDVEDVAEFTRDTWPDHEYDDYLPEVFPRWVEADDPDRRTLVADVDGEAVGTLQTVLLSDHEAWQQGLRVHPGHRGEGIGRALTRTGFAWARDRGAVVVRSMVFSWNRQGLGLARSVGFDPVTEFRRARIDPVPEQTDQDAANSVLDVTSEPDAAWRFWNDCDARDHLSGLAFDPGESWTTSILTRDHLREAARDEVLFVVQDGGTRGFANRIRIAERESERVAEYGVAAWSDARAADTLFAAIANDAADVGVESVRVPIAATVEATSDAALAGADLCGEEDFVLAADLTGVSED